MSQKELRCQLLNCSLSSTPTEVHPVGEWAEVLQTPPHGLSFSHSSSVCLLIPCLSCGAHGCWDHRGSLELLIWWLACKTTAGFPHSRRTFQTSLSVRIYPGKQKLHQLLQWKGSNTKDWTDRQTLRKCKNGEY